MVEANYPATLKNPEPSALSDANLCWMTRSWRFVEGACCGNSARSQNSSEGCRFPLDHRNDRQDIPAARKQIKVPSAVAEAWLPPSSSQPVIYPHWKTWSKPALSNGYDIRLLRGRSKRDLKVPGSSPGVGFYFLFIRGPPL